MLTTPENIRTLQRKPYRKAKQEQACRFHALYDKMYCEGGVDAHSFLSALARKVEEGFFTIFGKKEQSMFIPAIVGNDHHSRMLWCFGFFQ